MDISHQNLCFDFLKNIETLNWWWLFDSVWKTHIHCFPKRKRTSLFHILFWKQLSISPRFGHLSSNTTAVFLFLSWKTWNKEDEFLEAQTYFWRFLEWHEYLCSSPSKMSCTSSLLISLPFLKLKCRLSQWIFFYC